MSQPVKLRSGKDRLRYTFLFEGLLMAFLIPAGSFIFDKPIVEIGVLGIILSLKAMLLSLIYNWVFDRLDARAGRMSSDRLIRGAFFMLSGLRCH